MPSYDCPDFFTGSKPIAADVVLPQIDMKGSLGLTRSGFNPPEHLQDLMVTRLQAVQSASEVGCEAYFDRTGITSDDEINNWDGRQGRADSFVHIAELIGHAKPSGRHFGIDTTNAPMISLGAHAISNSEGV